MSLGLTNSTQYQPNIEDIDIGILDSSDDDFEPGETNTHPEHATSTSSEPEDLDSTTFQQRIPKNQESEKDASKPPKLSLNLAGLRFGDKVPPISSESEEEKMFEPQDSDFGLEAENNLDLKNIPNGGDLEDVSSLKYQKGGFGKAGGLIPGLELQKRARAAERAGFLQKSDKSSLRDGMGLLKGSKSQKSFIKSIKKVKTSKFLKNSKFSFFIFGQNFNFLIIFTIISDQR